MTSIPPRIVPRYRRLTRKRWDQLTDRQEVLEAVRDLLAEQGQHEAAIVLTELGGKLWDVKMRLLLGGTEGEGGAKAVAS
jgi:hypothetical protein